MNIHFLSQLLYLIVLTDCIWISFHPWTLVYQRPEGAATPGYTALPCSKSMFWPFTLDQTTNTYFLTPLQWLIMVTRLHLDTFPVSTHRCCSTRYYKVLGHMENLFHHAGKSMFRPFTPDHTKNTHFLSPLHGYK